MVKKKTTKKKTTNKRSLKKRIEAKLIKSGLLLDQRLIRKKRFSTKGKPLMQKLFLSDKRRILKSSSTLKGIEKLKDEGKREGAITGPIFIKGKKFFVWWYY